MKKALTDLEDESIGIIRETFKNANNPVVLYSIGKDSSVLLHIFRKAFYPSNIPVKFLHIDTGWKFSEMITFRNRVKNEHNLNIEVYTNPEGAKNNVTPFNNVKYTDIMKTEALKTALTKGGYDFIYGGARRDEEPSRSKEKILSHRNQYHLWEPKTQRIEPWHLFNTNLNEGESFRVFPLSNWTELNIFEYIKNQNIRIVDLYFAKKRKVVIRNNQIFLLDDNRFPVKKTDEIKELVVRFRTLGCYPLTSGIESNAKNIEQVIRELKDSLYSERSGRLIDYDKEGSMEIKKKEGYF